MSVGAILAIVVVCWSVIVIGAIVAALTLLNRHNRPVPSRPTTAPVWWLAAPTPSAFLHRRVVRSARTVQRARSMRSRQGGPTVLDDLAARFEDHSVALDDRITLAATLPWRDRSNELVAIRARIRRSEQVATELSRAYADEPAVPGEGTDLLDQVANDLSSLVEARRIVDDISRTAHTGGEGVRATRPDA